jgi:hypothetical protein
MEKGHFCGENKAELGDRASWEGWPRCTFQNGLTQKVSLKQMMDLEKGTDFVTEMFSTAPFHNLPPPPH